MSGWNFMHSPAADALARTLIYSLWEGTAVALALALVLCVLRSSRSRYAAACLAMLMILSALAVTFGRQLPSTEGLRLGAGLRSAVPALTSPHPVRMWPQITTPTTASQSELLFWVAPIWMAGVLLFWLRGVTNWLAVRRLRFAGTCAVPDLWLSRFGNLRNRLTLTRPVALLESSLADVPVVIGYLRPVILMPVGLLSALPVAQVEAILLHELAHVRRYDYLVNLAQVAIEGLLFYHPAVWWISGVMRSERENCCDDLVVATTGAAHEYASALTALERNRSPLGEALAATDGNLVYRVQRILGKRVRRQGAPTLALIPAMFAFMGVTAMASVLLGTDAPTAPRAMAPVPAIVSAPVPEPASTLTPRIDSQSTIGSAPRRKVKAPREAETEIAQALPDKPAFENPTVPVVPPTITVSGDVKNPGKFAVPGAITMVEALAKAGGVTLDAGSDLILRKSPADPPVRISLHDLETNSELNVTLTGGETITVPDAPKIWVTGHVLKPGAIRLDRVATVLKAVAGAEGLTPYYGRTAYIYRADRNGVRREIPVPLYQMVHHHVQDVPLLDDDILLVPDELGEQRRQMLQMLLKLQQDLLAQEAK